MKKFLLAFLFTCVNIFAQTITPIIQLRQNDANGVPVYLDSTVTILGIVTAANQFGDVGPAYIQDSSAGIAVYGNYFISYLVIGDSIKITAKVTNYNGLTELNYGTGSSFTKYGKGVEKIPQETTLLQISSQQWNGLELLEGKLVIIKNATINASGNFQGNTTYSISDSSGALQIYIDNSVSDIIGKKIPEGKIDLIGVVGQYDISDPDTVFNIGYQILPRFWDDIIILLPYIVEPIIATNITKNSFNVSFNTQNKGNTKVKYGLTNAVELDSVVIEEDTTFHIVQITELEPQTKYFFKAFSENENGTSESNTYFTITAPSDSTSGIINVYFNSSVDNTVAISGNEAIGNVDFEQKLIERINSATYSIDMAVYSYDGLDNLTNAIILAKNRGVKVRIVYQNRTIQSSMQELLNAGILMSQRPSSLDGIMHNKFAVIDARDTIYTNDWVWTGSWNWTTTELSWRNNVIEIKDPNLAVAYTQEFEEMWGSNTDTPDSLNAKFGSDKTDNTNHLFSVNGIQIESYFSPSDNTETQIRGVVNSADSSIYFALLNFTSNDIFTSIQSRHTAGLNDVRGIIEDAGIEGSEYLNLQALFGNEIIDYEYGSGKLHHKYGMVDVSYPELAPIVITGSHNWSASANEHNDENTLIIHNIYIANQYMQEFKARYNESGGSTPFVVPNVSDIYEYETTPTGYKLEQNYPNPFNPSTTIIYSTPPQHSPYQGEGVSEGSLITLKVYDILGQEIATLVNEEQSPGIYKVEFNGSNLSSGIYFYQLRIGSFNQVKKMVVLK
ncbi:MAG: T9SS type A sorting domain-containing protein [Ignavibacteriales bacterium]|nr:T9SS type A sorting domain-containing protein [Ignavibacteriales bacterium]